MANPITHFEIMASNGDELATFYGELFDWHVEQFPMPDGPAYNMIDTHSGGGINGGIGTMPGAPRTVVLYVEAPDLQKVLNKAEKLGGKTVLPVTEIPNVVTIAQFQDPQGNFIGLAKPPDQERTGVSPGSGPAVDWFEIVGTDAKALKTFYKGLFGWKISDDDYGHVEAGSKRGIPGGIGPSPTGAPMTTVYAKVDDLEKYIERAESLGAKTLVGPMDAGQIRIAQFADPQGYVFGLYQPKP